MPSIPGSSRDDVAPVLVGNTRRRPIFISRIATSNAGGSERRQSGSREGFVLGRHMKGHRTLRRTEFPLSTGERPAALGARLRQPPSAAISLARPEKP
jgi:hypothetical protein